MLLGTDTKHREARAESSSPPKHLRLIERTYKNNSDSDYTERIEELGKQFNYEDNRHALWGEAEFSTLYGTPLYEQASDSQKLALNHLYWVGQYNHTANAEANTMLYNQVTTGVFEHLGSYQTLCDELNFETFQERFHISTFQRVGYRTKLALLGKESLGNPVAKRIPTNGSRFKDVQKVLPKSLVSAFDTRWTSANAGSLQDSLLRSFTKLVHGGTPKYYSKYLLEREDAPIPTATGGLAGNTASPSWMKLMTLTWGSSPFMACHYYTMRMVANMSLKAYEYQYYKRFKDMRRQGENIPAPTAISHYHLLDESFHTTMSQVIAQEVYRDMPTPTPQEKLIANLVVQQGLKGVVGGLSGWLPATFRDDKFFMTPLYRLLQSPLFGFSSPEALYWMEQCLCHEHNGFHTNIKHHQSLLSAFQRFFGELDYLWPANRNVEPMVAGGSIDRAIQRNRQAFDAFTASTT